MTNDLDTQLNSARPTGSEPPVAAPHLVVLEGTDSGKQIALRPGTTTIGRAEDNDLILDTPHVSRHHATVVHRDAQYQIEDLKSRNGVIVNGRKLDRHSRSALSHGDAIRIGDQIAVFLHTSAQEDSQRLSTIHVDHHRVRSEVDQMLMRARGPVPQSRLNDS